MFASSKSPRSKPRDGLHLRFGRFLGFGDQKRHLQGVKAKPPEEPSTIWGSGIRASGAVRLTMAGRFKAWD